MAQPATATFATASVNNSCWPVEMLGANSGEAAHGTNSAGPTGDNNPEDTTGRAIQPNHGTAVSTDHDVLGCHALLAQEAPGGRLRGGELVLEEWSRFGRPHIRRSVTLEKIMIALYSYPKLFGVADNNGYGLKVFAFLKLNRLPFTHEHIIDASAAPRGQLPYIIDDGETVGDSDTIIAHLTRKYRLDIDEGLTGAQRDTNHLITRMLDDLYWVMSYSRWKDERFWPAFCQALRREHPRLTEAGLQMAREFNSQRYYYQGIGRYAPDSAYARGLADLQVLANLLPASGYLHGPKPTSIDAGIYGFIANIYFYDIDTPLKQFVVSHPNVVRHCTAIHAAVG
jgi:glutathione S-transferase